MNKIEERNKHNINKPTLSKEEENLFIQLIYNRLGIIIHDYQISTLNKTIQEACVKFNCTSSAYFDLVSKSTDQSPILEHLISGITVGETYFFRDKNQTDLLHNILLPNLIKQKRLQNNLSLRIWSAGCSSGEEISTVAMLLLELLPDINRWTLNLLGTDISLEVLQKALSGNYGEWSMRSINPYFKEKYFFKIGTKYQINPQVSELIKYDYLNLIDNNYPSIFNTTNSQDLILCRNVLIYFDSNVNNKIMEKLSTSLVPGGFLMLGASDPINLGSTGLVFHHDQGVLFSKPNTIDQITVEVVPKRHLSINDKQKLPKVITTIKKTSSSIPNLTKLVQRSESQIQKLLTDSEWEEVIRIVELTDAKSVFLMNAKATALANLGKLEEAIILLEKCLSIEPTDKEINFTYGVTLAELNRFSQAEDALKKCIFLDHKYVVAHYHLGLILIRNKKKEAGIKCLKNALQIAKTNDEFSLIQGTKNLSYGKFCEILAKEIDLYSFSGG